MCLLVPHGQNTHVYGVSIPPGGMTVPQSAPRPDGTGPVCDVGYVVHTYPGLSHAFVLREVLGIRKAGGRVETFSVHRAGANDQLSEVDRREAARTESILPIDASRLTRIHLAALVRHPGAYVRTLAYALRQRRAGFRDSLWQLFYFAEAIVLWNGARAAGVRHLHAHLTNVAADLSWLAAVFGNHTGEGSWSWSMTVHGPTEFAAVEEFNLARKVAAADRVICISDFCRSQLMALSAPSGWQKLVVVHCGADLERYPYRGPRATDPGRLDILSVGRLVPEKGQSLLLDAVASLAAEGLDVHLTVVGDGPDAESLRARAGVLDPGGHRFTFTGPLGQDRLPEVFAAHDVFCLPSFAEGVPVVYMEAMAVGLPVVATRIAGVPELIEDGRSGLLVAPGRADAVADALRRLAADHDLRRRLADAGRRSVEEGFDAQRLAARLAVLHGEIEEEAQRRRDTAAR